MHQPHPFPRFRLCLLALMTCFALQSPAWAAITSQGKVTLQSEADTNLIGARIKGEQVEIDAQNLILQSLQDTATFEGKQQNANAQVTVGYGFSASGSYSQSKIDADYKSVTEQTAILAGDGGYQINVRNNTDLTGALITSTQAAEDQQKNSLSTGTLTSRDLENYARYEGSSFGIGGSVEFDADFGLGENATPQSGTRNEDGSLKNGADSLAVSQSIGFGSDSESDSNTTRSGINTRNIRISDEEQQQALSGKTAAETIASLYTPTTTDTAEQNSGALQNNFDQDKVQKELDLQREVTKTFDANRQYVQREFNARAEALRQEAELANQEAIWAAQNGDDAAAQASYEKVGQLLQEADHWQNGSLMLNMIAGGLLAPTDSATGILASALAPAVSHEIGQYFKNEGAEGSIQHILAHAILGGAVAAAGGNDVLSAAIAAGGAEAITPLISNFLYGEQDLSKLNAEQRDTLTSIAGLTGSAIGGLVGNGTVDIVAGGQAAQTATENNIVWVPIIIGAVWAVDKGMTAYEVWQDVKAIRSGEKTLEDVALEKGEEYVVQVLVGNLAKYGLKAIKTGGKWIAGEANRNGDSVVHAVEDAGSAAKDASKVAENAGDAAKGGSEASNLANAARLRGQLIGKEIAGGHAFEKHILNRGEFKGLGIRTREQFAHHIENVVNNPTASRQLSGGRSAYWQESTGTVVIRNPRAVDGGTAFQPANGRAYFDSLR